MSNPLLYQHEINLPLAVSSQGCSIVDDQGKIYLDACSGAAAANLGHNQTSIKQAINRQLDEVAFVYRTQFMTQAKLMLARRLAKLSNGVLPKVYFIGSGSESVETCMKIALQYFWELGETSRKHFVSLRPSYHGSTLGALGLTGYKPLEAPFEGAYQSSLHLESPDYYRNTHKNEAEYEDRLLDDYRKSINKFGAQKIAAIAVEPIGGASTGARVLSKRYLAGLRAICDEIGALLIFDEVLTGIGRTGYWFAWQDIGIAPDIMALGKGLGAGYYPIAAMMCSEKVATPIMQGESFMHGHTYAGTPVGCAVGLVVLDYIEQENILDNVHKQGELLLSGLLKLQSTYSIIGDVRGKGLLYALEFVANRERKEPFASELQVNLLFTCLAKENGLLVYPRRCLNGVKGDHVLISPPLIIKQQEIANLLVLLEKTLTQAAEQLTEHYAVA